MVNLIADSCVAFTNNCPDEEIDSLKEFMSLLIKCSDAFIYDATAAIKDSGTIDTAHMLQPSTLTEIKKMCSQLGISYSNFAETNFSLAIAEQQKRNNMNIVGSPKETTELFRNHLIGIQKRIDSIRHILYYRMFVSYK